MIHLYSPANDAELAILRSLLEEASIPHFIFNEHFANNYPGASIPMFNAKTICVPEDCIESAKEIIGDYLQSSKDEAIKPKPVNSLADKLRMLLEFITFGWIMPGNRWKRKDVGNNQ